MIQSLFKEGDRLDISIKSKKLSGRIEAPPSKSMAHRLLICAGMASISTGEVCQVDNVTMSDDIRATVGALEALGLEIQMDLIEGETCKVTESVPDDEETKKVATVSSDARNRYSVRVAVADKMHRGDLGKDVEDFVEIDCKESGSTFRFIIPVLSIFSMKYGYKNFRLKTSGRLIERPLGPYFDILDEEGIEYWIEGTSLYIRGMKPFDKDRYDIDGTISSQFISGLLFCLPMMDYNSQIVIKNRLESRGYVDMTIDSLSKYGVEVENIDYRIFKIKGKQTYIPLRTSVEGDYSQAAFFLVANLLGNCVEIGGLNPNSLQGDRRIVDILARVKSGSYDSVDGYFDIDASDVPDIVPIIALLFTQMPFKTRIRGVHRLRIKESDRLYAVVSQLNIIGLDISVDGEGEDTSLFVNETGIEGYGKDGTYKIGETDEKGEEDNKVGVDKKKEVYLVDSFGDHRIAMTLAIAATISSKDLVIKDAHVVSKSYPDFWEDYKNLGGEIYEFDLGKKF